MRTRRHEGGRDRGPDTLVRLSVGTVVPMAGNTMRLRPECPPSRAPRRQASVDRTPGSRSTTVTSAFGLLGCLIIPALSAAQTEPPVSQDELRADTQAGRGRITGAVFRAVAEHQVRRHVRRVLPIRLNRPSDRIPAAQPTTRAPTCSASSRPRWSWTSTRRPGRPPVRRARGPAFRPGDRDGPGRPANEPRPDVYRHIWQAYGTYVFPVGRWTAGRFRQVRLDARLRDQLREGQQRFSRAYLFNFLPFYHSGLRLTLPVMTRCR